MMPRLRQLGVWSGIALLIALHVGVRLRGASEVLQSDAHRPVLAGSDSFYHAHRTHLLFEAAPRLAFHDPFMLYPEGAIAQWSLGFDWPVANALALVTGAWSEAVWWLPFVTLLLSLIGLLSFLTLVQPYFDRLSALLLTGCFALNLAFVRISSLAEYDHHVVETLAVVWLLMLPRVLAAASATGAVVLALALAWSLWTSTLLAFVIAGFLLVYALCVTLRWLDPPAQRATFALTLAPACTALALIEAHARGDYGSLTTLSLSHVLLITLSLGALAATARLSARTLLGLLALGGLAGLVVRGEMIAWVVTFVSGRDPVLGHVQEAQPLFWDARGFTSYYGHAFFGPALVLFPVAAARVMRRRTDALRMLAVFASLALMLALAQRRLVHLATPGFVLVLGAAAQTVARPRLARALVVLCLLEPVVVFFAETAHVVPASAALAMKVAKSIRTAPPVPGAPGVMTPPNLGSAINYAADLPSVTNAFFYPRYLTRDLTLRSFTDTAALIQHLRDHRIGFLVATDDVRYRTMLLRMLSTPALADEAATWERAPCRGASLRFAYDRIACGSERPDALTVVYTTQLGTRPERLFRRLTVFRVQPGAEDLSRAPAAPRPDRPRP